MIRSDDMLEALAALAGTAAFDPGDIATAELCGGCEVANAALGLGYSPDALRQKCLAAAWATGGGNRDELWRQRFARRLHQLLDADRRFFEKLPETG